VARAGWAGAMAGRRIVIPGVRNRLMAQTYRVSPRSWTTRVVRRLQEPVR
jgi:short-subunit dehydrogenase